MSSLYGRSRSSDEIVGADESARSAVSGAPHYDPTVRARTHSISAAVSGTGPRKIEDRAGDSTKISGRATVMSVGTRTDHTEFAHRLDRLRMPCDASIGFASQY